MKKINIFAVIQATLSILAVLFVFLISCWKGFVYFFAVCALAFVCVFVVRQIILIRKSKNDAESEFMEYLNLVFNQGNLEKGEIISSQEYLKEQFLNEIKKDNVKRIFKCVLAVAVLISLLSAVLR